jgi:hypothetical protein
LRPKPLVALCLAPIALAVACATSSELLKSKPALARELASILLDDGGYEAFHEMSTEVALQTGRREIEAALGREMTMREGAAVEAAYGRALRSFLPPERVNALIAAAYEAEFSREELARIVSFARTPAGKKFFGRQSRTQKAVARAFERDFAERREAFASMVDESLTGIFAPPGGPSPRPTVSDSRLLCADRNADPTVPYYCMTRETESGVVMVVLFDESRVAEEWWTPAADDLVRPFCAAMNSANRVGVVFLVVSELNAARGYACETGEMSHWFPWREAPEL